MKFSIGIIFGIVLILLSFGDSVFAEEISRSADMGVIEKILDAIQKATGLPGGDIPNDLIPSIIRFILGIFSVLLTGVALWSGILFVGQFGDEERIRKAKNILVWSLVGVVVTAISYAFVSGLVNIDYSS